MSAGTTTGGDRSRRGRLAERYRRRAPGEPRAVGYLYILPALIVYAVVLLFPFGQSVWLSFLHWDGLTRASYAGFSNYTQLFTDPDLRGAFWHAIVLLIFYSVIPVCIGLLLAAAMSRIRVRGMTFFRAVLFLPQVVAMVVSGVAWRAILAPDGLLNSVLRGIGLGSLARTWLGSYTFALPSVGTIGAWVGMGLCMVLFLAGAQRIPKELYEAARIDGAGAIREFFAVTLPGLRLEISVALTLTMISGLKNFDVVYVTTSGGPGTATTVPAYELYQRAFQTNQVGSAGAIGVALTVLIFLVTLLIGRLVEGKGEGKRA
ncbi:sugar ABC transporter permease [Mangrovactinospora gilvigrisea]|uniref:Sugar ABC transporter permease n=1 Tax=Mangrovactinospora gilvigrisea TaxID=1428644 RepID=A0A1J7B9Q2_9ACTN|nr:sugar ABC transporter permease [Mangrovactinospora gilvigrisea]OIV35342.1 sugar ABC transporter permease [Mangrovactinospora gilvigrisea]